MWVKESSGRKFASNLAIRGILLCCRRVINTTILSGAATKPRVTNAHFSSFKSDPGEGFLNKFKSKDGLNFFENLIETPKRNPILFC